MRVAITGAGGQVGQALLATAPAGFEAIGLDRTALDITSKPVSRRVIRETGAGMVINAAAYTQVDKAEVDVRLAHAVNRDGVSNLENAARQIGARFVHISTDFVFDGEASIPYPPDAKTNPLSWYGRSKEVGELAAGRDALIVRLSWVYAAGGANFVRTMLRLMRERDEVRVVSDQVGAPTWATGAAQTIWALAQRGAKGIYHHRDAGTASWYDFAVAIAEEAQELGMLEAIPRIVPISTADYPTPAARPAYSVLDDSATRALLDDQPAHWRDNLRLMLKEEKALG